MNKRDLNDLKFDEISMLLWKDVYIAAKINKTAGAEHLAGKAVREFFEYFDGNLSK